MGERGQRFASDEGGRILARRHSRPDLAPNAALPEDTKLWAALQSASGGAWAGCVYDTGKILAALRTNGRQGYTE